MGEITDKNLISIIDSLKSNDNVDCVALGGSRATEKCDASSDYDIYVYSTTILDEAQRKKAIAPYCSKAEICNHYWESEDNCIMNNYTPLDIIYRDFSMISRYLNAVADNFTPFNGYTTCFWHNIVTCKVLFDKSGKFSEIQKKYTVEYPEKLKENIINNNRKLLGGSLPSYDMQIKKAQSRGDIVSVHHRITEFLASYFDIIFALNKQLHPGEKRLVRLCKENCTKLPANFEENINALLAGVTNGNSFEIAEKMICELDKVIAADK